MKTSRKVKLIMMCTSVNMHVCFGREISTSFWIGKRLSQIRLRTLSYYHEYLKLETHFITTLCCGTYIQYVLWTVVGWHNCTLERKHVKNNHRTMHALFSQKLRAAFSKRELQSCSWAWKMGVCYRNDIEFGMKSTLPHFIKAHVFNNCMIEWLAGPSVSCEGNTCK